MPEGTRAETPRSVCLTRVYTLLIMRITENIIVQRLLWPIFSWTHHYARAPHQYGVSVIAESGVSS